MGDKKFNYGKAEADLYDAGCPDSEEIYGYRSEKAIESFMRENGLDPEKYYDNTEDSKSSSSNNNSSSGCYLTSACVNAKGLPDDCEELTVLRNFRDTFLIRQESGAGDIAHYYKTAPLIVSAINNLPTASQIWIDLYETLVLPCVDLIKQDNLDAAYEQYKNIALRLEKEYYEI